MAYVLFMLFGRKAHHPVDTKLIGKHAKIIAPEGLVYWHGHGSACRESIEEAIGFLLAIGIERDGEVVAINNGWRPFTTGIAAHQDRVAANGQRDVHDLLFHLLWQGNTLLRGHIFKATNVWELTPKN